MLSKFLLSLEITPSEFDLITMFSFFEENSENHSDFLQLIETVTFVNIFVLFATALHIIR